MPPDFCCLKCRSALSIPVGYTGVAQCPSCGSSVNVRNGVPLYLPELETDDGTYKGAERTFAAPAAYELVIKLRRALFKDAILGVSEYITGKTILDVGCGPSLNLEHMENSHETAAAYVGIDTSTQFVLAAGAENPGPEHRFAQAGVTDLPFADKTFDTTILSFTIHHVEDPDGRIMREVLRVTRSTVIIFDHLRSDNPLADAIQDTYWRIFDGGCNYMRRAQWDTFLTGTTVVKKVPTGAIFGHVIKMVCSIP